MATYSGRLQDIRSRTLCLDIVSAIRKSCIIAGAQELPRRA